IDTNGDSILETLFTLGVQDLHLDLKAGSLAVASFNHGAGAFIMNAAGIAGVASLQFQVGILGLSGTITLEVNTTNSPIVNVTVSTPGGPININLPNTNYLRVCVTNGYIHLGSVAVSLLSFQVVISGGNVVFEPKGGGAPYVTIQSNGSIVLGSLSSGNFDFGKADPFQFVSMLKQLVDWIDSL